MKMNGHNVVEDFDNISEVTTDKLIKLRDVAKDNVSEAWDVYREALDRHTQIEIEISKRLS